MARTVGIQPSILAEEQIRRIVTNEVGRLAAQAKATLFRLEWNEFSGGKGLFTIDVKAPLEPDSSNPLPETTFTGGKFITPEEDTEPVMVYQIQFASDGAFTSDLETFDLGLRRTAEIKAENISRHAKARARFASGGPWSEWFVSGSGAVSSGSAFDTTVDDLDDINDGASFVRVIPDEKTGAGRGFTNIDSAGLYLTLKYHDSAVREPSTVSRNGQTTASAWTTVSSYPIELGKQVSFQGSLTVTKISGGATDFSDSTPGTFANDATVGTINWSPLAFQSNVTLNVSGVSKYLKLTNWGFPIPSTDTILGITVTANVSEDALNNNVKDNSFRIVKGGTIQGDEKASGTEWFTTPSDRTHGGSSDKWGLTWLFSDINASGFGCVISAKAVSGQAGGAGHIHGVTIKVFTDGGTYTMKARLKVDALLSSEVSISNPTTTDTQTVSVSNLPAGTRTILVQAQVTAGSAGATVESDFTQQRYTDQHKGHFL